MRITQFLKPFAFLQSVTERKEIQCVCVFTFMHEKVSLFLELLHLITTSES